MKMDSKSFPEKIKATQRQLLEPNNGKLIGSCLEFTKESISYLNTIDSSAAQHKQDCSVGDDVLSEWYPVFVETLHALHKCRREKDVNLEIVLSHINHVMIHLVKFKDVPTSWFHCLGIINLEFLYSYHESLSHRPDYLSSLVQKSHQCMRIIAQRASGDKSKKNDGRYFNLLVIGCSYLTLECSIADQKQQDYLSVCKGYVSNFLLLFCRSGENSGFDSEAVGETAKELFKLCCMFYCLCGIETAPQHQIEKHACFFKELFRLVQHFPPFRDKLVHCDEDFSSLVADIGANVVPDGLSLEDTVKSMEKTGEDLHMLLSEDKRFQFTVSVCRVVHSLLQKLEDCGVDKHHEHQITSDLDVAVNYLHSSFADHPSLASMLPQHVGETVSVLSNSAINDCYKTLSLSTNTTLYDLLSLSLDALIRDVICYSGSPSSGLSSSVASMVSRRSYDMAVVSKSGMALLQWLLLQNNIDNSVQVKVSMRLKSSLNLLCTLVKKVKKGSGLSTESSAYRTIFKTLKNAVSSLGALCRLLRRSEKHNVIATVAGPLWPVANLPEMISHVSYHESLCEAYRVRGDVQAACQVVVQAAALGNHLVTNGLLRSILKIAKTEASLKIPVLFSKCSEENGTSILMNLARLLSSSSFTSQTMTKHQKSVLNHLLDTAHTSMSISDRVLIKLLLAEIYWYCPDANTSAPAKDMEANKRSVEPLDLLQDCHLESDVSCNDFKAQGIILAAEIRHALACMKMNQPSSDEKAPNSSNGDSNGSHMKRKLSKKDRTVSLDKGDYSHITPENDDTYTSSMPPPNALEVSELSSVFTTPLTHSVQHKGKILKQRRGLMKGKDDPVALNIDNRKQRASSSRVFPIWEDSKITDNDKESNGSTCGDKGNNDDDDNDVGMSGVGSTELMEAVGESLCLWKEWYQTVCDEDMLTSVMAATASPSSNVDKEGKTGNFTDTAAMSALIFRVDRSLTFLQHLISLALAHDKPILALDCLCLAKDLASKVHKSVVAEYLNSIQLSLLGQLGLVQESSDNGGGPAQSENKGPQPCYGEGGESSLLVSMASYLFYNRKIRESIRIQKTALAQIDSARGKEPLTPTLTLQLSQLKCLMVECSRVVELQEMYQEEAMAGQHPLQVVSEALKYITSLKSYLVGKAEHVLVGKGASVDSWQMISYYLNTLYLAGKVFLQAGMVKSSRTYFLEGLKMAQSCQLSTWHALFTTSLADISVNYTESVSDVSEHLKNISSMVPSIPLSWDGDKSVVNVPDISNAESVLASLSSVTNSMTMDPVLPPSLSSCDNPLDFSPKLSTLHVYRLWLEAEVALHMNPVDFPKVFQHLLHAKSYATSISTTLQKCGSFQRSVHSTADCDLLVAETLLRLAQAFFHLLAEKSKQSVSYWNSSHSERDVSESSADEVWSMDSVNTFRSGLLSLLEGIVHQGKQLSFSYEGKVLIATAQLLKIHTSFLTTSFKRVEKRDSGLSEDGGVSLGDKDRGFVQEGEDCKDVWMDCDDDDDDDEASCIAKEVKELKLDEEFWNEKHKKWMLETSTTSIILPPPTSSHNKFPCRGKNNHTVSSLTLCPSTPTPQQCTPVTKKKITNVSH